MANRHTFYLIVMTYVGLRASEGLVKMWARRQFTEPGTGPATKLAEVVVTVLS